MNRKRLPSGDPGLDEVLSGGFPENMIHVLMGAPGSGKTILAEQLVFANATRKRPALYLSTLSEPLEKLISNSAGYSFFRAAAVASEVLYEDLGHVLLEKGFSALPDVMTEFLTQRKPKIVVIDSFKALNELSSSVEERRRVLFELATLFSNADCTVFLVGEYGPGDVTELPVFAVADTIVSLEKSGTSGGEHRFLRVDKFRGTRSLPGQHSFKITERGLRVYPRLVTPAMFDLYKTATQHVATGVDGLDGLIEKGFWSGSTTLVAGPTGAGKTMLGLQFLRHGAKTGESALYVGFQENPVQLARVMEGLGWEPGRLEEKGVFEILYRSPVEMQVDEVAGAILERVRQGKVKRIVLDALGDLKRRSLNGSRFADFIYSLTQWFAVQQVTCLMTYELESLFEFHRITGEEISNMSDNVLLLRFTPGSRMERTIRVVKTRGRAHSQDEHILEIAHQGVAVRGPWKGDHGIGRNSRTDR